MANAGWRGSGRREPSRVRAETQRPLREPRAAAGGAGECPSFTPWHSWEEEEEEESSSLSAAAAAAAGAADAF